MDRTRPCKPYASLQNVAPLNTSPAAAFCHFWLPKITNVSPLRPAVALSR